MSGDRKSNSYGVLHTRAVDTIVRLGWLNILTPLQLKLYLWEANQSYGMGKPNLTRSVEDIQNGGPHWVGVDASRGKIQDAHSKLAEYGLVSIEGRLGGRGKPNTITVHVDVHPPEKVCNGLQKGPPGGQKRPPEGDPFDDKRPPCGPERAPLAGPPLTSEKTTEKKETSDTNRPADGRPALGAQISGDQEEGESDIDEVASPGDDRAVMRCPTAILRAAWDSSLSAAFPTYRPPPIWTKRELGMIKKTLLPRCADLDQARQFTAWSITYWRSMVKHEKLRGNVDYPSVTELCRYVAIFHAAWQRGAERERIGLLPFEERRLAGLLANGHTREAALITIAEERARAKDRDERAAHEARVDRKIRIAAAMERDVEQARRRGPGQPVLERTRPAILIEDATPEAIEKVLDQQMADYTPPDFDHDPYAEPAAG